MNLICSNKLCVIILGLALLQFAGPVYNLAGAFAKIPINAFGNVLTQSVEIKLLIKRLATSGVLILLLCFSLAYCYIIFVTNEKSKPFVCGVLFFISFGSLGYYYNNQTKLDFRESSRRFMLVDLSKGKAIVSINFKEFSEAFYKELKDAESGDVKLSISQRFYAPVNTGKTCTILNKKELPLATPVALDKSEISHLLENKKISFELQGDAVSLELRDLKSGLLSSREDTLHVAGKKVELSYDKAFFLAFYIESLDGKVLRVYA